MVVGGFMRSLLLIFMFFIWVPEALAIPRTEQDLRRILDALTKTSVTYGAIPAISQPKYVRVSDAALSMSDNEPVFIVFFPSGPRIYPQKILVWHEVVNDFIQGVPYCITYAPISGSMAAYKARVDGVDLIFDNEGRLFNNNSVLIDRNTGSLWLQLLGMAFDGPMFGKGLEYVPAWWSTWGLAAKAYPQAEVLAAPRQERKAYGRDPYGSYITPGNYYDDERILYPLMLIDRRLPPKTKILGIEYEKFILAIDENYVRQKKAVNFFLGPFPLLAVLDPRLNVVRVFERNVWDKQALFVVKNGKLMDVDSKTTWTYDGLAIQGKLKDAKLEEFLGINSFWFAWSAFHPESIIIPGATVVPDSALVKGDDSV